MPLHKGLCWLFNCLLQDFTIIIIIMVQSVVSTAGGQLLLFLKNLSIMTTLPPKLCLLQIAFKNINDILLIWCIACRKKLI